MFIPKNEKLLKVVWGVNLVKKPVPTSLQCCSEQLSVATYVPTYQLNE